MKSLPNNCYMRRAQIIKALNVVSEVLVSVHYTEDDCTWLKTTKQDLKRQLNDETADYKARVIDGILYVG